MTKLKDVYQIRTIEEFGEVAKLCDEKELHLLMEQFKGMILALRFTDSLRGGVGEPFTIDCFNWSPLPVFPDHLLENEGEGLVVTIREEE